KALHPIAQSHDHINVISCVHSHATAFIQAGP
ncbi:MAG: hypothetical protein ACI9R8_002233, partial [Candidatus Paceibacteria bacterium]